VHKDRSLLILRRFYVASQASTTMLVGTSHPLRLIARMRFLSWRVLPSSPHPWLKANSACMDCMLFLVPDLCVILAKILGCKVSRYQQCELSAQVQVMFYFIALHLMHFFGLEALIYALKPDLEQLMGRLSGMYLSPSSMHPFAIPLVTTYASGQMRQRSSHSSDSV